MTSGGALGGLSWQQAAQLGPETLLAIPIGATEQHGPHLPLSTDTDIAVAITNNVVKQMRGVVAAPALAYGASGEHAGFAGTLSIGLAATEELLVELARSASDTFAGTIFVSTHGGNAAAVRGAVERLRAERREVLAWSPCWGGDAHAGRSETSLMLAIAPQQVALENAAAGATEPLKELIGQLKHSGVRSVTPNGVLGDPDGASASEGQELLEGATADLIAAIRSWLDR